MIKAGQRVFSNGGSGILSIVYIVLKVSDDSIVIVREFGRQKLDLDWKRTITNEQFSRSFHVDEVRDAILELSR